MLLLSVFKYLPPYAKTMLDVGRCVTHRTRNHGNEYLLEHPVDLSNKILRVESLDDDWSIT
jgi:hypothetical protein